MRNEFYCDSLDVLKWTAALDLARMHGIRRVHHLAFLTTDRGRGEGNKRNDRVDADPGVLAYIRAERREFAAAPQLRDVGRGVRLAEYVIDVRVTVDSRPFAHRARRSWFDAAEASLGRDADASVVLLDPDNGLAGKAVSERHVAADEFGRVLGSLAAGSIAVLFQHQQRIADWAEVCRARPRSDLRHDVGLLRRSGDPVAFLWARQT